MKSIFALLLGLLLPLPTLAMELSSWQKTNDGTLTFLLLYSQQGKYYVEEFVQPKHSLQDRTQSLSFATKELALAQYQSLSAGFEQGPPPPPESGSLRTFVGKIWPTKNQWDLEWEKKYEFWVKTNFHADFYAENQIATDCADAAIALRWIFSRIHYLPAAQTLAGSGYLFTNEMQKDSWKNLPTHEDWRADQKFRAALNYILNNTYTHSLMKDLYPIAIRPESFRPGTVILNLYDLGTGHTEVIADVSADGSNPEPIRVLASDVPRSVRQLYDYPIQDWGKFPVRNQFGFHRFRWPVQSQSRTILKPEMQMPFFSEEQFSEAFRRERASLTDVIIYRLYPNWSPDYSAFMRSLVNQTLQRLQTRVKIVSDGYEFCWQNDCTEGTAGWEAWSTPSRDRAILRLVDKINDTYSGWECDRNCRNMLLEQMDTPIVTLESGTFRFRDALSVWANGSYSSDPRDPVPVRWGFPGIQSLPPTQK
jgi:hypothetical protein